MSRNRLGVGRLVWVGVLFGALSCGDGPTEPLSVVASIKLSQDSAVLIPGAAVILSAAPANRQGEPLPAAQVIWSSSDPAIATVASGIVTAVTAGNATITATVGTVAAHAAIRVKDGATVGQSGGLLTFAKGRVTLVLFPNTVGSTIQLVVDPFKPDPSTQRVVANTAFTLDAGSVPVTAPFKATFSYTEADLKNSSASGLKLYGLAGGTWSRIESIVDSSAHTVTALLSSFGTYAIFEESGRTAIAFGGTEQSAEVGTGVSISPSVRVVDAEGFNVPGVTVQFSVSEGEGAVAAPTVRTDSLGVASAHGWTLGTVPGSNKLVATVSGASGSPITFRSTGVAGPPARLKFLQAPSANIQNRTAFQASPSIQLIDRFGNNSSVAGITITASLVSGGGKLEGTFSRGTNASGVATFSDLLVSGPVGTKTISFTSAEAGSRDAVVSLTPGTAVGIAVVAGDNQVAAANTNVSLQPTVKISDADGNAVPGTTVHFAVGSGGGSLTQVDITTDSNGMAAVGSWKLGPAAGENTASANIGSVSTAAVIHATGTSPTATRLIFLTAPPTTARNRIVFASPVDLQLQDAQGAAVRQAGIEVNASIVAGGGQLLGDNKAITDNEGRARFPNLAIGGQTGSRTIQFVASDISPVTATIALAAGLPASLAVTSGASQKAQVGTAVAAPLAISVTDLDNNGVAGETVLFQANAENGQVSASSVVTDARGIATTGWTVGPLVGLHRATATTAVLPSARAEFTATAIPGPAAAMSIKTGNEQTGIAGRSVANAIYVHVSDVFGNGIVDSPVFFRVASGNGSLLRASASTLDNGMTPVPGWTLGPTPGVQTLVATIPGVPTSAVTISATAVEIRIITFGDSNTDLGYDGTSPEIRVGGYVSESVRRLPASAPNSYLQLAGKVERKWKDRYSPAIRVINHGVASTTTGTVRSPRGAPGAQTVVNGFSRFDAEVLGLGLPWDGGEPAGAVYPGPLPRSKAFIPTDNDFVYISIGTNDIFNLIQPYETWANVKWMIMRWISNGHRPDHLIITTLPPFSPGNSGHLFEINAELRYWAQAFGTQLIDINAYTSADNKGLTWRSPSLHVGDNLHYSEAVREWIADQLVAKIASATAPKN